MNLCYKITHLPTKRYYIGVTSKKKWLKGYLGSGLRIKRLVKKYPLIEFDREILWDDLTIDDSFELEELLVDEKQLEDPFCLNLKPGGLGGRGYRWTEEQKAAQKERCKGFNLGIVRSEETKKKLSEINKGKMKGRLFSAETRSRISQANKGRACSEETKEKLRQINLGKKYTPEQNKKNSESKKLAWLRRRQDANQES